jgi:hypothetical protein
MALYATEFDRSVKHRVVYDDSCTTTVNSDASGGPCVLKSIIIDNTAGSGINYVRCANGRGSTIGADEIRVSVPCPGRVKRTIQFPDGVPFERGLSFWCSGNTNPVSNTAPNLTSNTAKIVVTLVLG